MIKKVGIVCVVMLLIGGCQSKNQEERHKLQEENQKLVEELEEVSNALIEKEERIKTLGNQINKLILADKAGGISEDIPGYQESLTNVIYGGYSLDSLYKENKEMNQKLVGAYKSTNYETTYYMVVYPCGKVVVAYEQEEKILFEDGEFRENGFTIGIGSPGLRFHEPTLTKTGFQIRRCDSICSIDEMKTIQFERLS